MVRVLIPDYFNIIYRGLKALVPRLRGKIDVERCFHRHSMCNLKIMFYYIIEYFRMSKSSRICNFMKIKTFRVWKYSRIAAITVSVFLHVVRYALNLRLCMLRSFNVISLLDSNYVIIIIW